MQSNKMIKIYIRQIGLGAILVGAALMSVLLHVEVDAEDRDMMEMMGLVVLSQKFEECRKNKDDKKLQNANSSCHVE